MMEVTPDRNPSYFYGEEDSEEVYEEDVEAHVDLSQLQKTKKTVGEMVDKFVSTGDAGIDEKMRGGFMCSGITELVGESASGKTQFGLQLCLSVQRNSSQLGAIYISTECAFPSKRLAQLVDYYNHTDPTFPADCMSNIVVEHAIDAEALMKCVTKRLPILCRRVNAGVIVLDSVAAIYRSDYTNIKDRAEELRTLAKKLHQIARENKLLVVVINQVSAKIEPCSSSYKRVAMDQNTPSLGLAWTNMITTRILLFRNATGRFMKVVFSPYLPVQVIPFDITANGVSSLPVPEKKREVRSHSVTATAAQSATCSSTKAFKRKHDVI